MYLWLVSIIKKFGAKPLYIIDVKAYRDLYSSIITTELFWLLNSQFLSLHKLEKQSLIKTSYIPNKTYDPPLWFGHSSPFGIMQIKLENNL